MPELRAAFSANLRRLLEKEKSIAHVCREISINRQQFNRYLAGETLPSTGNIRKIAKYFDVTENTLFSRDHAERAGRNVVETDPFFARLSEAFSGDVKQTSPGRYFCYLPFPGEPVTKCFRGLLVVKTFRGHTQVNGFFAFRSVGSTGRLGDISRFSGRLKDQGSSVQILGMFDDDSGDIVSMHLIPVLTGKRSFFSGISMSSRRGLIASRRIAIGRISDSQRLLTLARQCGLVSLDSPDLDPWARAALCADDGSAPVVLVPRNVAAIVDA